MKPKPDSGLKERRRPRLRLLATWEVLVGAAVCSVCGWDTGGSADVGIGAGVGAGAGFGTSADAKSWFCCVNTVVATAAAGSAACVDVTQVLPLLLLLRCMGAYGEAEAGTTRGTRVGVGMGSVSVTF